MEKRIFSNRVATIPNRMLSPVELATLLFPSSFKGFVLKLLPLKLRRRIGEGRKQ